MYLVCTCAAESGRPSARSGVATPLSARAWFTSRRTSARAVAHTPEPVGTVVVVVVGAGLVVVVVGAGLVVVVVAWFGGGGTVVEPPLPTRTVALVLASTPLSKRRAR